MRRTLLNLGFMLISFLIFLSVTTPKELPAFFLPVPFLAIFIILYKGISLLARNKMSAVQVRKVASLGAGAPVILLILQSIGQLTIRDILVIAVLFAVSYFYTVRSKLLSN